MRLTGTVPPSKDAIEAVLNVLRTFPGGSGASTKDIFRRVIQKPPSQRSPTGRALYSKASPNPVRSVSYLKNTVLRSLQHKGVVEKIHVKPITSGTTTTAAPKHLQSTKKDRKTSTGSHTRLSWIWRVCNWETPTAGTTAERRVA